MSSGTNRIRAAIFPYCAELLPFVMYFDAMQEKYSLARLVSPAGMGLVGRDAGHVCSHADTGYLVYDSLGSGADWDELIVFIPNDPIIVNLDALIRRVTDKALSMGKKVFLLVTSRESMLQRNMGFFEEMGNVKICYGNEFASLPKLRQEHGRIKVPVIAIGGLLAGPDITEIALRLSENLRKIGVRPAFISRASYAYLIGAYCHSHIFRSTELNEQQKITNMNTFARSVELIEYPDVIIIEAPDAVLPYSDITPNGYGIYTHMLCQAVPPDYFICSVPYMLAEPIFIDRIKEKFVSKFGVGMNIVHVSNNLVDHMDMMASKQISFAYVPYDKVREHTNMKADGFTVPICDLINGDLDRLLAAIT